jgi:Ni2+-binding GTPase involved in maturation of urease and hydrogenase
MKLHLIGGFLGSGKTTAIINASRSLMNQNLRVGVITNDQGKYLVDTAFFRLEDLPSVEVTGGCFCCNYDDLDARLAQLIEQSHPDVIFAESVGSCADIVATVVKPLLQLGSELVQPSSFSVFTDARMLRRRLNGQEMPFSEDVVYIFDKQIEEAGLLVVNKIDLLSELAREELIRLIQLHFPNKQYKLQTSLSITGVQSWVELIQTGDLFIPEPALEIDYTRYGAGEANLAWLDETIDLSFPAGQGQILLKSAISSLLQSLADRKAGIGHLKFILQGAGILADNHGVKLSFPTLEEPGWEDKIPQIKGSQATLLVNARVELPANELKELVHEKLRDSGMGYNVQNEMAFHPPQPNPTHRFS